MLSQSCMWNVENEWTNEWIEYSIYLFRNLGTHKLDYRGNFLMQILMFYKYNVVSRNKDDQFIFIKLVQS